MYCLLKFVYKMLTEKGLNKLICIVEEDVHLFIKKNTFLFLCYTSYSNNSFINSTLYHHFQIIQQQILTYTHFILQVCC
jgi:hypothetical protein